MSLGYYEYEYGYYIKGKQRKATFICITLKFLRYANNYESLCKKMRSLTYWRDKPPNVLVKKLDNIYYFPY